MLLVKSLNFAVKLRVFLLNLFPVLIDFLELLGELGQTLQKFFDDNDAKHEALTVPPKSLNHKFKSDTLQHVIQELVLDDSAEKLGDLSEVYVRVLMQEPVFVEETVQDASIDLLLLDHLGLLEALQCHDELLDPLIDLVRLSAENVLEILVCGFVNFFSALGGSYLAWEQDRILGH